MNITVYVDILFIVNFIMGYVLLYTTAKITRLNISYIRIFAASAVSATYAVFMFAPNLSFLYSFISKIVFSVVLVLTAYKYKGYKPFIKVLCVFYLVSFAFGGGAFALFYMTSIGSSINAVISNGIFYFNLPWGRFIFITCSTYLLINIVVKFIKKVTSKNACIYKTDIILDGKSVTINALYDTGNSLTEPFTGMPVIVTEKDAVKDLIPNCIYSLKPDAIKSIWECPKSGYENGWTLIPYSSVGSTGFILGFTPDNIVVHTKDGVKNLKAVVGLSEQSLSGDKSYNGLLNSYNIAG